MSADARRTYTVLTCHFGDRFWISHALQQLDRCSDDRIVGVVVVDQSRESAAWLAQLPRVQQVLTFPEDAAQVAALGHDHPAALDRAMAQLAGASTSHLLVLDSDCFPVRAGWLDELDEVTVANDPRAWGLTHPCFLTFPTRYAPAVRFDEGLAEVRFDTGRLVGLQLARAGAAVQVAATCGAAFGGRRGHWYLDGALYHHGSGSFASSGDERLTSQVDEQHEAIYRRHLSAGRFELARTTQASLFAHRAKRKVQRTVRGATKPAMARAS